MVSEALASAVVIQKASQATVIHLAVPTAIAIPRVHTRQATHIPQDRAAVTVPALIVYTAKKAHHQRNRVIHIMRGITMMLMISTMTTMTISGIMKMPRIIITSIVMIKEMAFYPEMINILLLNCTDRVL